MNLTWEQETIRALEADPMRIVRMLQARGFSFPDPEQFSIIDPFHDSGPDAEESHDEENDVSAMLIRDLGGHNLLLVDVKAYPGDTGNWHSWPYYADETHEVGGIPLTLARLSASQTTEAKGREPIGISLPRSDGFRTTAELSRLGQLSILCDTRFVRHNLMQRMYAILTDPDLDRDQIGERLRELAQESPTSRRGS